MNGDHNRGLIDDPAFQRLLRRRQRIRFGMAALLVGLYLGYSMVALYLPDWFSAPLAAGSVVGWGLPIACGIILLSIGVCGWYVHWANTRFEAEERQLGSGDPEPRA